MEESLVQRLFEAFSRHPQIPRPREDIFIPALRNVNVDQHYNPHPLAVFTIVPDTQSGKEDGQLVEEDERYHYLSLRRVIATRQFRHGNLPRTKPSAILLSRFSYSSDVLLTDLAFCVGLQKMVNRSDMPFALFGKLKTYDYGNNKDEMFHISRPVLVIPGQETNENITAWEDSKTLYQREFGLLGLVPTSRRYYTEVSG